MQLPDAAIAFSGRLTQSSDGAAVAGGDVCAIPDGATNEAALKAITARNHAVSVHDRAATKKADTTPVFGCVGTLELESNGRYAVGDLVPGGYRLRVISLSLKLADGYYSDSAPGHFVAAYSDATVLDYTGDAMTGLDVAFARAQGIRGSLIRAGDGQPLYGELIAQLVSGESDPDLGLGSIAYTASDGSFRLRGLAAGSYRVLIVATDAESGCYSARRGDHGFTADCGAASPVPVGTSNVHLRASHVPAGLTLKVRLADAGGAARCGIAIADDGTTDALEGSYGQPPSGLGCGVIEVIGVRPGSYRVVVASLSQTDLRGYYSTAAARHWVRDRADASTIDIQANQTIGPVDPKRGFGVSGRLKDRHGDALRYEPVSLVDRTGTEVATTDTDRDGTYALPVVPAGMYRLHTTADGPSSFHAGKAQLGWYDAAAPGHFSTTEAEATEIEVGPTQTGINMMVPDGFIISGSIRDSQGHDVFGRISFYAVGSDTPIAERNASGAYSIGNLPPGTYQVHVAPEFWSGLAAGWYRAGVTGHFSKHRVHATQITVGP